MITYSCDICNSDILDADPWHGEVEKSDVNQERSFSLIIDPENKKIKEDIILLIDSLNSCYCDDCMISYVYPALVKELLSEMKMEREKENK